MGDKEIDESRIEARLRGLCAADDAAGVAKCISELGIHPWQEAPRSKTPVEYAIEADAPAVFEALAFLAGEGDPAAGMRLRLGGGIGPAHACACVSDERGWRHDAEAPKCLAVALRLDPLAALARDDDGRSVLDWAAMGGKGTTFPIALGSLARAIADGAVEGGAVREALARCSFKILGGLSHAPTCLERLESLSSLGFDWRGAVSEGGQSLLGRMLACWAHSLAPIGDPIGSSRGSRAFGHGDIRSAKEKVALLILAGANLDAPIAMEHDERGRPSMAASFDGTCEQYLFKMVADAISSNNLAIIFSVGDVFGAAIERMDDARCVERMQSALDGLEPTLREIVQARASVLGDGFGRSFARFLAAKEAAELGRAAKPARRPRHAKSML